MSLSKNIYFVGTSANADDYSTNYSSVASFIITNIDDGILPGTVQPFEAGSSGFPSQNGHRYGLLGDYKGNELSYDAPTNNPIYVLVITYD